MLTLKPISVNMASFCAPVYASWLDPASGLKKSISNKMFINKGKLEFTPPGKNSDDDIDWILLLVTG